MMLRLRQLAAAAWRRLLQRLLWRRLGGLASAAAVTAAGLAAAGSDAAAQPSPAFSDVAKGAFYFDAVDALASAGVFVGTECDEGFCPDRPLRRWEMAVWLIRALGETDPNPAHTSRFDDVADNVWWLPHVERMADLEITYGCSSDLPRYCPDTDVTRAQMASFLSRALNLPPAQAAGFADVADGNVHSDDIDRLAAAEITLGCATQPRQYCPQDSVTRADMAAFIHRSLKWLQDNPPAETTTPGPPTPVLIGNDTDEFITEENDFSRYIKEKIVGRYGDDHPWLRDTWNHTNRDNFLYLLGGYSPSVYYGATRDEGEAMNRLIAITLASNPNTLHGNSDSTLVHEMAHVYTTSNRVVANPAPIGAAHLYFSEITQAASLDECEPDELYAETASALIFSRSSGYWRACPEVSFYISDEAVEIVGQAFSGQIPDWFRDTYSDASGRPNYEAIWSSINRIKKGRDKIVVVNQFRYTYGGYCSEADVWESLKGNLQIDQPWRDGGCPDDN